MGTIADFHCTFDNSAGISPEVTDGLSVTFPDAYLHWEPMMQVSRALKEHECVDFCKLPFCHTLEGEAMGGNVNYGDARFCPRAGKQACQTIDDLLACTQIDFSKGRIAETLKACTALREQGENVVLLMSGPFSILNVLMDATILFRLLRKEKEKMQQVFDHIRAELVRFTRHAVDAGVNIISYADSTGGINIIGPKNMEWVSEIFTVPLLNEMIPIVEGKAIILLCPKTSFALLGTEKATWLDLPAGQDIPYVQACLQAKDQAVLFGHNCINNVAFRVNGTVRAVSLVDTTNE